METRVQQLEDQIKNIKNDIQALQRSNDSLNQAVFALTEELKDFKNVIKPIAEAFSKSVTVYSFIVVAFKASAWFAGFLISVYMLKDLFKKH